MCDNHVTELADRLPVARKLYLCEECGGPILPWMTYRYRRFVDETPSRYEYRTHVPCAEAVEMFSDDIGDGEGCWLLGSVGRMLDADERRDFDSAFDYGSPLRPWAAALLLGRRHLRREGARQIFAANPPKETP